MSGSSRRALLLPGWLASTSGSAAQACAQTLAAHGWSPGSLPTMELLRWPGAGATLQLAGLVPGLFDAVHFGALRNGGRLSSAAAAYMRFGLSSRLREHLDRNPTELVISTGPAAVVTVSALAPRYPALRHVVLCLDAAPHRLWIAEHVDLYLMTHPGACQHVLKFQPGARVATIAPPVRPEFYRAPSYRSARVGLGIEDGDRCVLLITGIRGLPRLDQIARALTDVGLHVIAVAGHHGRLGSRLRQLADGKRKLSVFGYTDRLAELMAAADLVITSPGTVCAEARTVGRPLLLLDAVPGHGRENLLSELARGDAAITPARPEAVAAAALASLERFPLRHPAMSLAEWEAEFCGALKVIDA